MEVILEAADIYKKHSQARLLLVDRIKQGEFVEVSSEALPSKLLLLRYLWYVASMVTAIEAFQIQWQWEQLLLQELEHLLLATPLKQHIGVDGQLRISK